MATSSTLQAMPSLAKQKGKNLLKWWLHPYTDSESIRSQASSIAWKRGITGSEVINLSLPCRREKWKEGCCGRYWNNWNRYLVCPILGLSKNMSSDRYCKDCCIYWDVTNMLTRDIQNSSVAKDVSSYSSSSYCNTAFHFCWIQKNHLLPFCSALHLDCWVYS